MTHPEPHPDAGKVRILVVLSRLAAGGPEAELRLLATHLPQDRYRIDAMPCVGVLGAPDGAHERLREHGIRVDGTACGLSFEETVLHLSRRLPGYDLVLSCQDVADIYPALERLALRPPLIEVGRSTAEALSGPKHLTTRYVAASEAVRAAAARRMPDRPKHAVLIPPMLDLAELHPDRRAGTRAALGLAPEELLVGWAGPLGPGSRALDFIEAAALVASREPRARFLLLAEEGLPPEEAEALRTGAGELGIEGRLVLTGDRPDMADLLVATDAFCWLSPEEGMPHAVAGACAAGVPLVATVGPATPRHLTDGETALLAEDTPAALAEAILALTGDPAMRARLGGALAARAQATHAPQAVVPQWERLFAQVLSEVAPAPGPAAFRSFLQGGWECSTHKRFDGLRLDVTAATRHDAQAEADYRQLGAMGLATMRDGLRWHLIEREPGRYDFSSWTPMLEAARRTGTQVIWDLLHYGWPDGIDIWTPAFVDRFAALARAAALHHREVTDEPPFWCPVNEMNFHSWAGAEIGYINPFAHHRGFELKCQLARASIAAMEALREVDPRARFIHCEPLIAVRHDPVSGLPRQSAENQHEWQYQAWDLIAGRMWPMFGGRPAFLDVVGINYYWNNQRIDGWGTIDMDHPAYTPLSDLLFEVHARYGRPLLIAETGIEGDRRAAWFRYVADEVARARARGVPVEGICLYPIANHVGWDNDRICPNGLLGHEPGPEGREVHEPLAREIEAFQQGLGRRRRRARA